MFLREDQDLVIEKAPVAGVLADGDDGNQEARSSGEIGSLSHKAAVVSLDELEEYLMARQHTWRACFSSTNNLSIAP
jgi:hypothetical protein